MGREIKSGPNVLITAYPVRGLDINSSYTIYNILNEEKKKGVGILFVGEDLDVMLSLCDKIMVICEALEITPEELLIGGPPDEVSAYDQTVSADGIDLQIMRDYLELSEAKKKRLLAYMSMLLNTKEKE